MFDVLYIMSKNLYSQSEVEFLTINYPLYGADYCAKALNRTKSGVISKCSSLGIKSGAYAPRKTDEEYFQDILDRGIEYWPIEEYKGARAKILHECLQGHTWKVLPRDILNGSGCPHCSSRGFKPEDPAILYYVRLHNSKEEVYYKIGVTNLSVGARFLKDTRTKGIRYEIIDQKKFLLGKEALVREQELLEKYKEFRVKVNGFLYSGNTELFASNIIKEPL